MKIHGLVLVLILLLLLLFTNTPAMDLGGSGDAAGLTTLILLRHAEKADDGTLDPPLTPGGETRAAELAYLLGHVKLDAVYATTFKRTQDTVRPTARAKGLEIESYRADRGDFLETVLREHRGGTVLICGHSNTVPKMANALLGREEYAPLDDSVYDNLFIVTMAGSGPARITRIRFGVRTPEE